MSALIFYSDPNQIVVATDTLATSPDGAPISFCNKAVYLPHIRTIVAGTGLWNFVSSWCLQVNRMTISGLRNLDYHTPSALNDLWNESLAELGYPEGITGTIYHFGFAENDSEVLVRAYRSTSDFESEPIDHGFGLKPECSPPASNFDLNSDIERMMREQRENGQKEDAQKKIYIGGKCICMHLTLAGCQTYQIFQFEDYEELLSRMFQNFS